MKKVTEFYPWKQEVTDQIIERYKSGRFSTLSLDMRPICRIKDGGRGGCIYCMSRQLVPGEFCISRHKIRDIIKEAADYGITWLYGCGASEPFDDKNSIYAMETALHEGMQVCAFTNALSVTPRFASWLYNHDINLIVKCDSLHENTFNSLMRSKPSKNFAKKVYKSIDNLLEAGYEGSEKPSMAISIVTSSINYNEIPEVVQFCLNHGIFPLVRHAKFTSVKMVAGRKFRNTHNFSNHNLHWYLPTDESAYLKAKLGDMMGGVYEVPLCPTPIAGLHVSYSGKIKIDGKTGLSCNAFTSRKCQNIIVGNVQNESLEEVAQKILNYRKTVLPYINKKRRFQSVFGGCGGSRLITTYYRILRDQAREETPE